MSADLLVARDGATAFVRVIGLANLRIAPMLDAFLIAERGSGMRQACFDLAECSGMDSTFMGLLVGHHQDLAAAGGRLLVVRSSEHNRHLLDMLGVSSVIQVADCAVPELDFIPLDATSVLGHAERAALVSRAHRHLSELSEANRAKFASLLAAVEADLARRKP